MRLVTTLVFSLSLLACADTGAYYVDEAPPPPQQAWPTAPQKPPMPLAQAFHTWMAARSSLVAWGGPPSWSMPAATSRRAASFPGWPRAWPCAR